MTPGFKSGVMGPKNRSMRESVAVGRGGALIASLREGYHHPQSPRARKEALEMKKKRPKAPVQQSRSRSDDRAEMDFRPPGCLTLYINELVKRSANTSEDESPAEEKVDTTTSKITKGRVGRGPNGRWLGSKRKYADADDPIYSQSSVVGGQVLSPKGRSSSRSEESPPSVLKKTPEEKEELRKASERVAEEIDSAMRNEGKAAPPKKRPAPRRRSDKTDE